MSRLARIALNSAGLAAMAYGYRSMHVIVNTADGGAWIKGQSGGLSQFLTMDTLVISSVVVALAIAEAIVPLNSIVSWRRLFALIAIPTSLVVFIVYWPMLAFAPSLLTSLDLSPGPKGNVPAAAIMFPLPMPVDLSLHVAPAVTLIADWFVFGHGYSYIECVGLGVVFSVLTGLAYGGWVEWCASENGTFPYPFLNVNIAARIAIYLGATVLGHASWRAVNALHPTPHPTEKNASKGEKFDIDWDPSTDGGAYVWFNRRKL